MGLIDGKSTFSHNPNSAEQVLSPYGVTGQQLMSKNNIQQHFNP